MLVVLLATMPGFLAVVYASIQQFHGAASNVSEEALRAVRVAVRRNDDKTADVVRALRSISFLGRRQSSDEVCRDLRLFDFRVILADASAKIICRTEENSTEPVSDSGRRALEEAARTGEFAVGDYEIDESSDSSGLSAAYPITLGAEKLFALTDIDLSWFSSLAGDLRLPDGSSLIAIDAAGKILAQFPNPRDGVGKPVGEALTRQIASHLTGTQEFTGTDGIRRLYAFARLDKFASAKSALGVGIPVGATYGQASRSFQRSLALLVAAMIVIHAGAYLAADRLVLRKSRVPVNTTGRRPAGATFVAGAGLTPSSDKMSRFGTVSEEMAGNISKIFEEMGDSIQKEEGSSAQLLKELLRREQEAKVTNVLLKTQEERLHLLSQELMRVQETEREQVARELHDVIGQKLTVVSISLQMMQADHPQLASKMDECMGTLEKMLKAVRDLSLDLRPPMIDELGLAAALRWYLQNQPSNPDLPPVEFDSSIDESRLTSEKKLGIFRIVQEAMTSVVRHANARNVSVSLNDAGDHVDVKVQNDGSGFDFSGIRENFRQPVNLGLIGMEERARQMGGQFAVESRIGAGTIVRVQIPMT